ncbi:1-acyl-sn-glycerol-3-phosphate acyltransferase [Escherichia coli]|nr:1-acyl-sn-glycerol-3-phosphate acyltransferase [Escherichia coli]EJN3758936.1 1-acyl-sn-glycerol-3-phosphate acyltransferase [Escherichia coli]MCT6115137.1 1-acyl-sn-glycerol-3-phosphate acyltransferase [Escherichia coli]
MSKLMSRLEWTWRLVMTGLCFALFGLGGLLLSVVWFNILLVLVWDTSRRRRLARRSIAASFRLFLTVAKGLGVLDYRIDGAEILRQERGCLVVANHPTLIDYVLRAADYLINSEAETLLPRCQQRLAQGDTILIFPEGTRTKPGEKMTLQRGAANIAVRCASDLRIVTIGCSEHLLDKQSKWYDVPPDRPFFTVEVHGRVEINKFYDATSQEPALAARQLNRHLLLQLQQGCLPLSGINNASALSGN